jgi:hypothetical protein
VSAVWVGVVPVGRVRGRGGVVVRVDETRSMWRIGPGRGFDPLWLLVVYLLAGPPVFLVFFWWLFR